MRTFLFGLFLAAAFATPWIRQANMITARSDADSVVYKNWIFIGGGCAQNQTTTLGCQEVTDKFEAYNVLNNTWSSLPNLPRQRYRHECILVKDTIYFIAGRDLMDNIIQDMDIYNITSQTWRNVTQNVTFTSDGTAFMIGNSIYYTGGYNLYYNVTSNQTLLLNLSKGEQFEEGLVADKTVSTGDLYSAEINGFGYVFGGFSTDNGFSEPYNTLEVYNPQTNTWVRKLDFITARGDMAGVVIDDFLYIIGGEAKNSTTGLSYPVANVEVYDPSRDTWRELTPIAESRFRFTSSAYGAVIYNIGGQLSLVTPQVGDPYWPITNHVYSYNTNAAFALASVTFLPFVIISCLLMLL